MFVFGPSLQERQWGAGACPEKGNEAGEGSGEQVLRGSAEGTGFVYPREEEVEGGPYCLSLSVNAISLSFIIREETKWCHN